jgi:thiosulfate/3-mercaptopyruvate sulfurtransferase
MSDALLISTADLAARLNDPDLVVIDGSWHLPHMNRDARAEYRAGHIPGAVFFDIDAISDTSSPLPHMLPTPAAFGEAMTAMGVGDGMSVVVYDSVGLFSAPRVRWTLREMGARDVRVLDGGLPKWIAEGRALAQGEERRAARLFTPRFNAAAVVDYAQVRDGLGARAFQVADARPAERFRGEAPEPRPNLPSGHMPGARSVPATALVADGRLRTAAEIDAAFRAAGVDPDRPVVASCGSGVTSAVLTLALEAIGRPAFALYDGSWTDWAGRPDAAVAIGPA